MKQRRWQYGARNYLVKNLPLLFFVIFVFVVGVVFGSLAIRTLDSAKRLEMMDFLSNFFSGLAGSMEQQYQTGLQETIWLNLKIILFMWILSLSIIGVIGIPILVFLKGFVIGFTVGFLVNELGLKGMIFALASILPHNLITIPATIFAGVLAISFGIALLKTLISKKQLNTGQYLLNYSGIMVLIGGFLLISSLIETFITPVFMELVARLIIKG